jgi:hypothetical protein
MEITQIYGCQEILMRVGELQTEKEKECDRLFKDPKTRELLIKEEERLKNMKDNLEQEIVKNPHYLAVNEANSKILAAIDYDKLKQKYNSDIIEKAVNTMCSHAETFQEGDMEKLAMSHEVYSKPEQYTSSDVDYAEVCIEHGIC